MSGGGGDKEHAPPALVTTLLFRDPSEIAIAALFFVLWIQGVFWP